MKRLNNILIFSLCLAALNALLFFGEPKITYIKSIDVASPLKEKIVRFLGETDTATGGLFSRHSIRPVTVLVGKLDEWKMAESEMTPFHCVVTLNDSMNWNKYELKLRTTILHELGHCYGFWLHDDDPSSIMYWSDNEWIDQDSITAFLVRMKARGNVW